MKKSKYGKMTALILSVICLSTCRPLGNYASSSFPRLSDFDRSQCEPISFFREYEYNDIVIIAELYPNYTKGKDKPDILVKVLDFYKGHGVDLIGISPGLDLEARVPYLIFAKKINDYYFVDPCSRSNRLEWVSKEDKEILFEDLGVVCIVPSIRNNRQNYRCTREYAPVCGCDGKTYGNACEAGKAGVVKYSRGGC